MHVCRSTLLLPLKRLDPHLANSLVIHKGQNLNRHGPEMEPEPGYLVFLLGIVLKALPLKKELPLNPQRHPFVSDHGY